jgi:hypothetical protein
LNGNTIIENTGSGAINITGGIGGILNYGVILLGNTT